MQDTLQTIQSLTRGDSLKLVAFIAKHNLESVEKQATGLSDTVLLAIVAGIVAIATLVIKGIIEHHAEKAKTVAALEAAKITETQKELGIKIDGRLSQLIESLEREGVLKVEKALKEGKEQGIKEEQEKAPPPGLPNTGPVKLKIVEGEIKVTPSETKKK